MEKLIIKKWVEKNIYMYDYLVGGYVILALILSAVIGFRIDFKVILQLQYDIPFLVLVVLYFVIYSSLLALHYRREGKDDFICGVHWRRAIFGKYFTWRNVIDLFRVLILLKLTLLIYCNIKQSIPSINGRLYDTGLLSLDRMVHFGFNPSLAAGSIPFGDTVIPLIDKIYLLWYILKPLVLAFFIIIPDRVMHIRFFTAYFAIWIFGGLAAVIIPSLGPVYIHPEWFNPRRMHFAASLQHKLLVHYEKSLIDPAGFRVYIYEGIAAFPSLHVGIVALFTFFIWKVNRTCGIAMALYTLLIQAGSVLLGWHYAVDGYFGIILAYLLFRLAGRIGDKEHPAVPDAE